MEYRSLWNLPTFPKFTDPFDQSFQFSEYFFQIQKAKSLKLPILAEQQEFRAAFTKWADDNGIKHPSCEYTHLFYSKEGFPYPGVIATKDIHPNETIVEVPAQLTVTAKRAYQELKPIFDAHPDVFCKLPDNCYSNSEIIMIVTYLIAEQSKGEKSWLYNVLRLWPKQVDTALMWERKELEELQDKSVLEDMIKAQLIFEEFHKKYYSALSQYKNFKTELITKEAFFRMLECVGSRIFHQGSFKFAPYIEFINDAAIRASSLLEYIHDEYECKELIHSTGLVSCKENEFRYDNPYYWIHDSKEDHTPTCLYSHDSKFQKGEEVVFNYSCDENITLIKYYGFCMEFNINDSMFIPITQMLRYPNKLAILLKFIPCEDPTDTSDLVIPVYYQSISNNLINYSKLLISKEEDFTLVKTNIKLELAAVDMAIELIRNFINEHPTTLKQDMELLAAKPNSYRMFMSVTCRAWRKRIGYHQIYLLEIVKEMLHRIENGASKKDSFDQPTKIEDGVNEFNLKLTRRMILSYIQLIK